MNWQVIGWVAAFIIFLVVVLPRVLHSYKNSPSSTAKQWMTAIIPIGAMLMFVFLLVILARQG
jgi:hypothetical protein